MKKQIVSLTLIIALVGCATHSTSVTSTDANGKPVVTQEKTSQSDNAAMAVVGSVVKIGGDILTAVLPPLVPMIVHGFTQPVGVGGTNNAAK